MKRTGDEVSEHVRILFAFKNPNVLPEELRSPVTQEEYDSARRAFAKSAFSRLKHSFKFTPHIEAVMAALGDREDRVGHDYLARTTLALVDYVVSPGSHSIHRPYRKIVYRFSTLTALKNYFYSVLDEALLDFLIPEWRQGEWAESGPARGCISRSKNPLDDALPIDVTPVDEDMDTPDTGDSIETYPSQAEVDAIRFRSTLETERTDAANRTAELLAGYPKEIIDLAYAMGEHGQLKGWAHEHGVPHGTARRWAKELREEILGARKMYAGYWDDVSARCERAALKAHPPEQHGQWAWGQRTDAHSGCTVTGLIHSGEIPSGYVNIDRDVAAVYYRDLRRG